MITEKKTKVIKVVIDPGHGFPDPGAVGVKSTEAEINLSVGRKLLTEFANRGHNPTLTRNSTARLVISDRNADLGKRPKIANEMTADCFISLHCNSAVNKSASGFEIYTTPGQNISDPLATEIFKEWQKTFPQQKMRTDYSDGDPDKEANFAVIRLTRCPSVLIEMGFISNPAEEDFLLNELNQNKMATAIANAVEGWFS